MGTADWEVVSEKEAEAHICEMLRASSKHGVYRFMVRSLEVSKPNESRDCVDKAFCEEPSRKTEKHWTIQSWWWDDLLSQWIYWITRVSLWWAIMFILGSYYVSADDPSHHLGL